MPRLGLCTAAGSRHVSTIGLSRLLLRFAIVSALSALDAFAQPAGVFVPTGQMNTTRVFGTATLLRDGRVLIAGGIHCNDLNHCDVVATAELFDPFTGVFTRTGNMAVAREASTAVLLQDGRVLIAGGTMSPNIPLFSAELYDPATGTFTATGNVGSHVGYSSGTLLRDGKVLVVGNTSAEIYDPTKGAFTPAGSVIHGGFGPLLLPDGRVLMLRDTTIGLYEFVGGLLRLVASFQVSGAEGYQTLTLLMNGRVLISGGVCTFDTPCKASDDASLFDPHSGTLAGTGLLAIPRLGHEATVLPGGRVLIAGGNGNDYDAAIPCAIDAEEYDPSTGSFAHAGTEALINCIPRTTLLPDGRVLITGGSNVVPYPGGAELYIPSLRAASAASLTGPLAPESVASLFGSRLASTTAAADPLSLPTTLGGISLRLRDNSGMARLVPLFFVSPVEIRFAVPPGTALGDATLELVNGPTQPAPAATRLSNVAPAIFPFDDNLVAGPSLARATITLSGPVDFAFYATGVRNRSTLGNVRASIGGTAVTVLYAGPDPSGIPGLDLVKVHLPSDFGGRGRLDLVMTVDGIPANTASVEIRGIRSVSPNAPRTTDPAGPRRR